MLHEKRSGCVSKIEKLEQSSSITMYKTVAQNTSTSVIKRQTENVYKADVLQCKWQIRILKDQGYIYQ